MSGLARLHYICLTPRIIPYRTGDMPEQVGGEHWTLDDVTAAIE